MNELRELAWEYATGRVFPEDLPMAAALALARGVDSPALRELAALNQRSAPADIRELFEYALSELGLESPSWEDAARRVLRRLAEGLISGRTTPREVARACDFEDSWMNAAESTFAARCFYHVDMVEHVTADRLRAYEDELIDLARAVLAP